jgi:predicted house-cleaning noncanonical NTP pyrophosphatase (MazG superfamily)
MKYNKLVRDKIPEIIKNKGEISVTHKASDDEYARKLREKLNEEVNEFLKSNNPEELADIIEVVNALGESMDINKEKIESLRLKKAEERGSFKDRIILDETG